jgi:plastin-1
MAQISLKNFPELVVLLQQDESLAKFMKLPAEQILLRWINYHLTEAGSSRRISNFGGDVTDSEIYSVLLNRLNSSCPLAKQTDAIQKANQVIKNARTVGAAPFIKPKDICDGNKKLNMSFAAQIFNACPGLVIVTEEAVLAELSGLEIEDSGDSREERVFRMWINSLNLDGVFVNDLYDDMSDGLILLRLLDHMAPGVVVWKKVTTNPDKLSRFKKVENCNLAVNLGKEPVFKFSLVNIGGLDVCDGNKKIILAYVWQLCRKYTLQVLVKLAASEGIAEMTDEKIVSWANAQVADSGKSTKMKNLKDSSLKNSIFFLDLVHALEPRAVDFTLVNAGSTDEEKMLNAKYVINCARKVGACIFLTPEDIVECKSKMLLTFVAALWEAALTR